MRQKWLQRLEKYISTFAFVFICILFFVPSLFEDHGEDNNEDSDDYDDDEDDDYMVKMTGTENVQNT